MVRVLLLLLLINIAFGATAVTVYTDSDYKPYSYVEEGKVQGIHIEILKSIFKKMPDYRVKIKPIAWEEGLKKMRSGEILMLLNPYYRPKERPYILDYSLPYMYDSLSLYCNRAITLANPKRIDWAKEFKGIKIAKPKGWSLNLPKAFDKALQNQTIKLIEDTDEANIHNLINKKIDCYINDSIAIQRSIILAKHQHKKKSQVFQNIKDIVKITELSRESTHIGFSKKHFATRQELIKQINRAIKAMKKSGEIDLIIKHSLDLFIEELQKPKAK
ncbi:MAG: amino acid ABC transporter substrate-binding protein [Campylobacterales bacterium]|nr:amino acid ABC transporter substrate-binding protein [Campylobacterales bacterium]